MINGIDDIIREGLEADAAAFDGTIGGDEPTLEPGEIVNADEVGQVNPDELDLRFQIDYDPPQNSTAYIRPESTLDKIAKFTRNK